VVYFYDLIIPNCGLAVKGFGIFLSESDFGELSSSEMSFFVPEMT